MIAARPVQVTTAPAPPSRSASALREQIARRIAGARVVVLARLAVAFEGEIRRQIDRRHHRAVLRIRFEPGAHRTRGHGLSCFEGVFLLMSSAPQRLV